MTTSDQMLSVVLAVHNAEKTLSGQVSRLLDMLPDLTSRFELMIVDDASTDQTEEVAHELARSYPQMRVAHHSERLGPEGAEQTALDNAFGDVVVLHAGDASLPADELSKIWAQRHETTPADPPTPRQNVRRPGSSHNVRLYRCDIQSANLARPTSARKDAPANGSFPRLVACLMAQREGEEAAR